MEWVRGTDGVHFQAPRAGFAGRTAARRSPTPQRLAIAPAARREPSAEATAMAERANAAIEEALRGFQAAPRQP
eukprot:15446540-Alexandrium_andersonii.AAC.1